MCLGQKVQQVWVEKKTRIRFCGNKLQMSHFINLIPYNKYPVSKWWNCFRFFLLQCAGFLIYPGRSSCADWFLGKFSQGWWYKLRNEPKAGLALFRKTIPSRMSPRTVAILALQWKTGMASTFRCESVARLSDGRKASRRLITSNYLKKIFNSRRDFTMSFNNSSFFHGIIRFHCWPWGVKSIKSTIKPSDSLTAWEDVWGPTRAIRFASQLWL